MVVVSREEMLVRGAVDHWLSSKEREVHWGSVIWVLVYFQMEF